MSPFFHQIAVTLGFPIRLQLSAWAGKILYWAGVNVTVEGNMMMLNGSHFTVDEACMGLNMLAFSMLMGVFSLAHQYRIQKVRLTVASTLVFFLAIFTLDVLCNLLRIMLLVLFAIAPDNPMHEIVGLFCFLLYVIAPMYAFCKWFVARFGKQIISVSRNISIGYGLKSFVLILAILICLVGVHIKFGKEEGTNTPHTKVIISGFQIENMNDGITKLHNEESLIYIKPIAEFFTGEHTPLICWRGSGYNFEGVSKIKISGHEIYVGQLVKPGQTLFTAWWYSNGKIQTINQFDWRVRMLKGEGKFCLINVTANDNATLQKNVKCILNEPLLAKK
jgi:exosortase N